MDSYTAGFLGGILMGLLIGAIGTLFVGAVKDERRTADKFRSRYRDQ